MFYGRSKMRGFNQQPNRSRRIVAAYAKKKTAEHNNNNKEKYTK